MTLIHSHPPFTCMKRFTLRPHASLPRSRTLTRTVLLLMSKVCGVDGYLDESRSSQRPPPLTLFLRVCSSSSAT